MSYNPNSQLFFVKPYFNDLLGAHSLGVIFDFAEGKGSEPSQLQ